jgi:hypothetical protein
MVLKQGKLGGSVFVPFVTSRISSCPRSVQSASKAANKQILRFSLPFPGIVLLYASYSPLLNCCIDLVLFSSFHVRNNFAVTRAETNQNTRELVTLLTLLDLKALLAGDQTKSTKNTRIAIASTQPPRGQELGAECLEL